MMNWFSLQQYTAVHATLPHVNIKHED